MDQDPFMNDWNWPSPMSAMAIWASGARSPDAPNDPILGTTGAFMEFTRSNIVSTTSGLIPDAPLANELALMAIILSVAIGAIGSPIPHAWLRTKFRCNNSNSSGAILTLERLPKPVFMPYTVCSPSTILSTCDRESFIMVRDFLERENLTSEFPISIISSIVMLSPSSTTSPIRIPPLIDPTILFQLWMLL